VANIGELSIQFSQTARDAGNLAQPNLLGGRAGAGPRSLNARLG
jgi:hypothetical protein